MADPYRNRTTILIRPTSRSPDYAVAEGLQPFTQWICLTNADTFISGPFDFATISGRKSRDRIPAEQWNVLIKHKHLFTNATPSLSLPDYSVHSGQFHSTFECASIGARIDACLACPSDHRMV